MTGIGSARKDAATNASACPAMRLAVGRTASPALGSVSSGSALAAAYIGPARAALDGAGIAEAERRAAAPLPEPAP